MLVAMADGYYRRYCWPADRGYRVTGRWDRSRRANESFGEPDSGNQNYQHGWLPWLPDVRPRPQPTEK